MSDERYTRVCARHQVDLVPGRSLDELRCPGNGAARAHSVRTWIVVDRRLGRAQCRASAAAGVEEELNMPLPKTGNPATPAAAPEKAHRVLESVKFRGVGREVLWLRLESVPIRDAETRFRIRWQHLALGGPAGGKGKLQDTTGVVCAAGTPEAARNLYEAELQRLLKAGWTRIQPEPGYRRLQFKPAPGPRSAGPLQGRKP